MRLEMNVLFVTHTDSIGGANQSLLQLIRGIKEYHNRVGVIVVMPCGGNDFEDELNRLDCTVLRFAFAPCVKVGKSKRHILRYLKARTLYNRICNEIKNYDVDIIHTNSSVCDLGIYLSKRFDIPHVWHVREVLEYYNMTPIMPVRYKKMITSDCNRVVCISHYLKKYIDSQYPGVNSRVIYNGFDIPDECCKTTDMSVHNLIIAGVVYKNKGQMDAIKAMSFLVNKYNRKDVCLYIVGTQPETIEFESQLRKYAIDNGIEKYVRFFPFSKELDTIRKECDIALQCSIMEGMGRVTIESMLSGLLVIGANSGATRELIDDGVNGWLYEPNDAKELAEKINTALDCDKREQIRRHAYEWAKSKFDYRRVTDEFMEMYEEIRRIK